MYAPMVCTPVVCLNTSWCEACPQITTLKLFSSYNTESTNSLSALSLVGEGLASGLDRMLRAASTSGCEAQSIEESKGE